MYNKLFAKILDSSIWLEADQTRIVWMTLLAAMDEDGFAPFACVDNLAHRARVPLEAAKEAIKAFESPDENSGDPDNEGRRVEKVPGGWLVLNAPKYRDIVTRAVQQQRTRERVARFREVRKRVSGNARVTPCNGHVTHANDSVTQSEAEAETNTSQSIKQVGAKAPDVAAQIYEAYPRKVGRADAIKSIRAVLKAESAEKLLDRVQAYAAAVAQWPVGDRSRFVPHPATWFRRASYDDDPETWKREPQANGAPKLTYPERPIPSFGRLYPGEGPAGRIGLL
jgi:hypothetical protein